MNTRKINSFHPYLFLSGSSFHCQNEPVSFGIAFIVDSSVFQELHLVAPFSPSKGVEVLVDLVDQCLTCSTLMQRTSVYILSQMLSQRLNESQSLIDPCIPVAQ